MIDKSRVEIRLGSYGTGPADALADATLLTRVREYRRLTASRTTPLERGDVRARIPAGEHYVSRKVDGEFTVLAFDGKEAVTINPGGTVRVGLPLAAEAAERLGRAGLKKALVAGELYVVRQDGKRPRIHDVIQVARRPSFPVELESLRLAVFDILEPACGPFTETWKTIQKVFDGGRLVHPVESSMARGPEDVDRFFAEWVDKQGAEGIVVRSDAVGTFKIKPRRSVDAAVVGFTEGVNGRQGLLHDMLVALMRQDGTFHVFGRVGGGFTDEDRRSYLSDLKDMAADSDYAEVNPDHVAYQMVRPEWVVELSCLDLVSQTTRGGTIDRMVLHWNSGATRYEALRRLPLTSAISPIFIRRREDKSVRPADLRLQQITDFIEVPLVDRDVRQLALPWSELLQREVYTKVLKGQTMVRKLVLWKTNKEAEGRFPAYVLHFTDFSPNRKTPLEREIRVSHSREQMAALWAQLAEENILKGWVKA